MKKDLEKIFGPEDVADDEKTLLAYSFDASDVEGKALAVVWPRNSSQVSDLMKYCSENNVKVFPRGSGTNLSGGAVPFNGIVVDFSRMNDLLEEGEDYVVVEPGVILEDLEKKLNEKNKAFPVMPASDKACSVGGCIAEDSAGMRAIKYGSMKDWVLEIEVVLPSGEIKTTPGKEFIASEGTLGLITKAKLKIAKKPKIRTLTVFELDSFKEVQEHAIKYAKEGASSVELISKRANSMVEKPIGVKNTLLVEFEDDRGEIKDPVKVKETAEMRKGVSSQLAAMGYVHVEDPRVPIDKTAEFLEIIDALGIPTYGHLGYGVIHGRVQKSEERKQIVDAVLKVGGDPVGEHGIGVLKKNVKHKPEVEKLKPELDPKNILNPGKVVSGGEIPSVEDVEACVLCGMCRSRCPVYKTLLTEAVSPRGMAIYIEKGIEDTVFWDKCTQCRACDGVCSMNADMSKQIREKRVELIKKGIETIGNKKMMENVRKYGNPFGELKEGDPIEELYCC